MIVVIPFKPLGFDAMTAWPFIFVNKASCADTGLIEHEQVHYREQAWNPVWGVLYWFSRSFRQAAEVRAYRRQIEVGGISIALAAHYLCTLYRLNISFSQALDLLSGSQ